MNRTHITKDDFLVLSMLQGMGVMWDLVALGFDFVPSASVVFLLTEKPEHYQHVVYKSDIWNLVTC